MSDSKRKCLQALLLCTVSVYQKRKQENTLPKEREKQSHVLSEKQDCLVHLCPAKLSLNYRKQHVEDADLKELLIMLVRSISMKKNLLDTINHSAQSQVIQQTILAHLNQYSLACN